MRVVLYRGAFCAYWRENGVPKRVALRAENREAAERRLEDLKRALRRPSSTVAQIAEAYLADRPGMASIVNIRFALSRVTPVMGHLRPDQVDRAICRAYTLRRRRQGVKDGTVIKELSALRAALRWQDKNTPAIIEMPPSPPPKDLYLTRADYRALRDAAKLVPHLYLFIVLAYSTAGRRAAILELTWDRVDFHRGIIRLGKGERRTKGRATVPMTDGAREALAEARPAALTDYVIEYAGRPVGSVKRAFRAAVHRAKLPDGVSPHVLRHSAAVHMAESGVPMSEISQFLGHTTTSITERVYARYSPDYLRRAAGALE